MKSLGRFGVGFSVTLLLVAVLAFIFQTDIHDFVRLRGYTPGREIIELADDTTMLSSARRLFYVNHPVIADSEKFNEKCRENEHSIVLGCYLVGQRGIYLLNVTDDRLAGIQEVTAAHELLHAAYERLSGSERERVDRMTSEAFAILNDARIKETIELYRKQDPKIVPNELHSILGTEVRVLPDELEQYYSRYFHDRLQIVAFAESYEQAFIDRRNAIRDYDTQLQGLKGQIDGLSEQLITEEADLRQLRSRMDSLRSSNNASEYNQLVPEYNRRVNTYNRNIDRLSGLIVQYNDIVQKRNSVAAEEAELVEAIDSRDLVPRQQ